MKKFLTIPLFLLLAGCNTATGTNTQVMNDSTKTLLIDSQLYDCVGVAPMKCMKVKELPAVNGLSSIKISKDLITKRERSTK